MYPLSSEVIFEGRGSVPIQPSWSLCLCWVRTSIFSALSSLYVFRWNISQISRISGVISVRDLVEYYPEGPTTTSNCTGSLDCKGREVGSSWTTHPLDHPWHVHRSLSPIPLERREGRKRRRDPQVIFRSNLRVYNDPYTHLFTVRNDN